MADRNEYVISNPAGATIKVAGLAPGLEIEAALPSGGTKLVELTAEECAELRTRNPSLLIEPNIRYRLTRHPSLQDFQCLSLDSPLRSLTVKVTDEKTKSPVADVTVVLIVNRKLKKGYKGRTGTDGVLTLKIAQDTASFEVVALLAKMGYWTRKLDNVSLSGDTLELFVRSLPPSATEVFAWGADDTKLVDSAAGGGKGVKIAIVDTGISKVHPDLNPAGGCNCVSGEDESHWYEDGVGHGTHCAGIVGARLNQSGIKSYAPEASIYSYRVFPNDENAGASTFDIVKALSHAIADGVDLISMSLGSPVAQQTINTKIQEAYNHGIMVIAATGNEGTQVGYPAAFPAVVGVGAYGKFGTYPDDSLHHGTESDHVSTDKQRFVADFSNFGEGVDFIAPGVAVYSTVPGGYAAWDGTSMACPHVTGLAALALASHPELMKAPRRAARVDALLKLLRGAASKLGAGTEYEGDGCPHVDLIIAAK